jgi:hypothetical protein
MVGVTESTIARPSCRRSSPGRETKMSARSFGTRWRVERSLGEGGQAHTFIVRDVTGEHPEAAVLKRLKNVSRLERFAPGIHASREINHRNVVSILDANLDVNRRRVSSGIGVEY